MDRNDCCGVEIVRAAADGIVLSQDGEKSPDEPHLKFFIENTNSPVQPTAYGPFSVLDVRTEGGVPHFLASHGKERLLIRATATAPFIELLSSREAAPLLARLNFDAGDLHTNRGRHLLIRKEIRFGPGNSFRLDSGEMPKIVEQTGNGALRQFDLPQSTYEEIARANKDDVNWVNWPIPRSQVMVEETIGPAQVVGSRLWFGKYFYSGEGYWGAGGFGYFDAVTRRFRILSPPEIRNASVFALRIDGTTAWLALGQKGEWGDSGEGVVRVDTQTLRVRKYMVPGMGTSFARYGDRLYVGTSEGLSMILPNDQTEHFFIDLNRDRTYRLSRSGVFR
jgi:hypothetical protein